MSVLDRIRKLNRKTQKRLYILGYLCGPIALLFCLIVNERVNDIPAPNPVDIPTETALVAKASTFGRDFLILWLAGAAGPNDKALQARIDEISSIPGGITLPATSFSITEVKDLGPEKYTQEPDGDRNWIFEYDVIGTAPGDLAPQKRRYSVQFVQHGVSYRATRTPLPINATATPSASKPATPKTSTPPAHSEKPPATSPTPTSAKATTPASAAPYRATSAAHPPRPPLREHRNPRHLRQRHPTGTTRPGNKDPCPGQHQSNHQRQRLQHRDTATRNALHRPTTMGRQHPRHRRAIRRIHRIPSG